jgi:general secretion pathway protein N
MRRRRARRIWGVTVAATGWGESTFAEQTWEKARGAATRWAIAGAVLGVIIGLVVFAPAAWMASYVASATSQRLVLADARGSVWSGSAVLVLTGGADSRDAAALPGRMSWTLSWRGLGFDLKAQQACCINGTLVMQIRPGFGRMRVTLIPASGSLGQWPSAWLGGLGTPFNTLQLGGSLRLSSPGLTLESVKGRWLLTGGADIDILNLSSRVSTLDTLGSYRFSIVGDPANAGVSSLSLSTQDGVLQLGGNGSFGPSGLRFRGEASANAANEVALSNLLNIIGRRDGARSVISIG